MTCDTVRGHLDDWLDDAVDPVVGAAIESHLSACDSCRAVFERHRKLAGDLLSLGSVADRMAEAAPRGGALGSRGRWQWLIRIAAAVMFAAGTSWAVWSVLQRDQGAQQVVQAPDPDQSHDDSPIDDAPARSSFRLAMADGDTRMVVLVKSENPRIHIFWLYDTISPSAAMPTEASPGDTAPSDPGKEITS